VSQFKFLKSRDDYYRHFTALDIGTELIKVLVVRRDGQSGHVLGVGREPQHPDAMDNGAIANLDLVINACDRALEADGPRPGRDRHRRRAGEGFLVLDRLSARAADRQRP
jgi:hypothetical protein